MSPVSTSPAPTQPPYAAIQLLKGAFVLISRITPSQKTTVPFQYNPSELKRTLKPAYKDAAKADQFVGPAQQSIDITARLEASDNGGADPNGIFPYLAALELMINPSSSDLQTYASQVRSLGLQAPPPAAPRVLFVWGPSRVLPVKIEAITVTETYHNEKLTPVMADVAVSMTLYPFQSASDADVQYMINGIKNLETQQGNLVTTGVQTGVNPAGLT